MKHLAIALLFGFTACANTERNYIAQQHGSKLEIQAVTKSKDKMIRIAFETPVASIIRHTEIKNFHQERFSEVGKTTGGGQPVDGFVAINYLKNPETLEIHLLTLSACSCRHVELHEANGSYTKAKSTRWSESLLPTGNRSAATSTPISQP